MHSTNNLNDNYLGSGKILQKAIKKYGKGFNLEVKKKLIDSLNFNLLN
jgi:hypothetical protein